MGERNDTFEAALKISRLLDKEMPHNTLLMNDETTSMVLSIDGADYILSVIKVPSNLGRETVQ